MRSNIPPGIGSCVGRHRLHRLIRKGFDEEDALLRGRLVAEELLKPEQKRLKSGHVIGLDPQAVYVLIRTLRAQGRRGTEEGFRINLIPLDHADRLLDRARLHKPLNQRGAFVQRASVKSVDDVICL